MGFVSRIFTAPGTGDQTATLQAAQAAMPAPAPPIPQAPSAPPAPTAPPSFGPSPGQQASAQQRAQIAAPTILGAAATAGQTQKAKLG